MSKHEFMVPCDVAEGQAEAKVAPAAISATPLAGTWSNSDPATRRIVKIVIVAAGAGVKVHAFGACTPTPCDMGAVHGFQSCSGLRPGTICGYLSATQTNSIARG
jgi:hypothetical protein